MNTKYNIELLGHFHPVTLVGFSSAMHVKLSVLSLVGALLPPPLVSPDGLVEPVHVLAVRGRCRAAAAGLLQDLADLAKSLVVVATPGLFRLV